MGHQVSRELVNLRCAGGGFEKPEDAGGKGGSALHRKRGAESVRERHSKWVRRGGKGTASRDGLLFPSGEDEQM